MKASRGERHDYLGMVLDHNKSGKLAIDLKECVKKMAESFPGKDTAVATTPAALHLFEVRDDAKIFEEEKAILHHNLVARGSFLCKRARPDISTAIAFLSTRVSQPDVDDWKKLNRRRTPIGVSQKAIR